MRILPGDAQPAYGNDARGASRWSLSGGFAFTMPTGEFADFVDAGVGFGIHGVAGLDPYGIIGIRLDAAYSTYGSERFSVPLGITVPGLFVDVRTRSHVGMFSVGPQIQLPVGPVRPYVNGFVGLGYFYTSTALGSGEYVCGCGGYYGYGSATSFNDVSLGYGARGGFDLQLSRGPTPPFLALDAQFRRHAAATYVPNGGVFADEFGGIMIQPVRSRVDFWLLRFGVSVGL